MITHTFKPGALVSPRSFISLVISASLPATSSPEQQGFYTVQIPLTHNPSGPASHPPLPDALRDQIRSAAPKNTVFASYASVERLLSRSGQGEGNNSQRNGIEWTMATTSDAGGLVPQWVQRSWTLGGVPKAVVADVGLFLGWTAKRRTTQ
jgi:hypothetical protein